MKSWSASAVTWSVSSSASRSAMSIPDDTPAAVMIFPCSTTRSGTGHAPVSASSSRAPKWVVAGRPSRSPAAPSTSDPVQTDVV